MKKIVLFITCIALACAPAGAQNHLERLGERANNAAENNLGNKVEKGVNDILNGKGKKEKTKDMKDRQEQPAQQTTTPQSGTWTCPNPECGHTGNTGKFCEECGTKKPATAAPQNKATTAYAKSDFVPGDEIFFDDPVENELLGEFPSKWDLVDGNAEIVELNGEQVIELVEPFAQTTIRPLMKEDYYLPEEFTIEFDLWCNWKRAIRSRNSPPCSRTPKRRWVTCWTVSER